MAKKLTAAPVATAPKATAKPAAAAKKPASKTVSPNSNGRKPATADEVKITAPAPAKAPAGPATEAVKQAIIASKAASDAPYVRAPKKTGQTGKPGLKTNQLAVAKSASGTADPIGKPGPAGAAVAAEVRDLTELPAAGPTTPALQGQLNGHSPASKHLEAPFIEVYGAREHNLKNVSVKIPRNRLVVFTGISGSGKSSLAFDTIYAEGQRRYMETFSAYARSFMGGLERPDVDKIEGLSPVISIEQKTTSRNPRSTVGHGDRGLRLTCGCSMLVGRPAALSEYAAGPKMIRARATEQIVATSIRKQYAGKASCVDDPRAHRAGPQRRSYQKGTRKDCSRAASPKRAR